MRSGSRGTSTRIGPPGSTDLAVRREADGTTVISGSVADQAALHGLLQRVRDLGLPLVSVTRVETATADLADGPRTSPINERT